MSFNYDPYAVMTIVLNADGTFSYLCDSCGGGHRIKMHRVTTLDTMRIEYDQHIAKSHALTREDTATWHKGY